MIKATFLTLLALQTCLDRRGFSSNAMDGQYGAKTQTALLAYCTAQGLPPPAPNADATALLARLFPDDGEQFIVHTVTAEEIRSLTKIPSSPADKAALTRMNFESIREMLAERGHVTQNTLARLNPGVKWNTITAGTEIRLPEVSPVAIGEKAALVRISLSRFTISVLDARGKLMAIFPCSIARDKAKRPPPGVIRITDCIEGPNYTYTPERGKSKRRRSKRIFPPGPNNPVGTHWIGLSIPGYGIHGTPSPGTIGRAESHGCFRLANWNAEKLFDLVSPGTRVSIDP